MGRKKNSGGSGGGGYQSNSKKRRIENDDDEQLEPPLELSSRKPKRERMKSTARASSSTSSHSNAVPQRQHIRFSSGLGATTNNTTNTTTTSTTTSKTNTTTSRTTTSTRQFEHKTTKTTTITTTTTTTTTTLVRRWSEVQTTKTYSADEVFTVASYNILAEVYALPERYRSTSRIDLAWDYRKYKIVDCLLEHKPDIICLQEVDDYPFLRDALAPEGYEGFYTQKTGGKEDGCAMFWKVNRFSKVDSKSIYFKDMPLARHEDAKNLSRDQVAQIVFFEFPGEVTTTTATTKKKHKQKQKQLDQSQKKNYLCVSNTHALWNPRRGDIKARQLQMLFHELEKSTEEFVSQLSKVELVISGSGSGNSNNQHRSKKRKRDLDDDDDDDSNNDSTDDNNNATSNRSMKHTVPAIICGDFNLAPYSKLYRYIETGKLNLAGLNRNTLAGLHIGRMVNPVYCNAGPSSYVTHGLGKLHSAYAQSNNGCEPMYTTHHRDFKGCVDYIWFTPSGLELCGSLHLPAEQIQALGDMPTKEHGSDHLMLLARFAHTGAALLHHSHK